MSEVRDLAKVMAVVVLIGIIAIAIANLRFSGFSDLTADYYAKITLNGTLHLLETYDFHVSTVKYRMLYRIWKAPLYYDSVRMPCVVLKSVEGDGIPYAKDALGRVFVFSNSPLKLKAENLARDLAELNEVGIICGDYLRNGRKFEPGVYELRTEYVVYPPIQTDGVYDHVNIKLAEEHVPYNTIRLVIRDPNGAIVKLYPHVEDCKVEKRGDEWIVTAGNSKLVELEFVLRHGAVRGLYERTTDVLGKTERANYKYNTISVLRKVFGVLVLAFPLVVLVVYYSYGREKSFTVPEYLSYVPNKDRKPWEVNLLFSGDAMKTDVNGFYATLLDLNRRGIIEIEPYEVKGLVRKRKELRIRIKSEEVDTSYERDVIRFLKEYSVGGVFDTKHLRSLARDRFKSKDLAMDMSSLFNWTDARFVKRYLDTRGKTVFVILSVAFFSITVVLLLVFGDFKLAVLSFALLFQSLACVFCPSQIFGRWKGEYYKEWLEWNAFRRFLSDMAMMKKYGPEDISIWKEWLVYGTALGVGDRVVRAMKSLNVNIPDVIVYDHTPTFRAIYRTSTSFSGASGGGGFGVGGGFGGGGAGGR